jgi:hypothetical protein
MKSIKGLNFVVFFILFISLLGACNKPNKNPDNTPPSIPVFQVGESILIPKTLELVMQNVSIAPFIPIMDMESSYQTLPHVYFDRDHFSIVRYENDGTSVFTSIEKGDSPNYEVGYIVEKTNNTNYSNAPYTLDPKESKLYPRDPQMSFLIARFSISNPSNQPFDLNDLDLKLEMDDQSILLFDKLLSETILLNPPNQILKAKESTTIQILALVPSSTKHCYIHTYERKIEWKEN